MARKRGRKQKLRVDEIREQLVEDNPELLAQFDELVSLDRPALDLYALLNDNSIRVSYSSVCHWRRINAQVGDEADRLNKLALPHQGINTHLVLQYGLSRALKAFDNLCDAIDKTEPNDNRFCQLVSSLSSITREIRSLADQIDSRDVIRDRRELNLTGAYEAIAEMELAFKDTVFQDAFRQAARGAIAKIEGR